MKVKKLNQNK